MRHFWGNICIDKVIIIPNAIAAAAATPGYAQETSNFDDFKIGAVVGYDKVRLEIDGDSGSKDGVLYGFTAGYDHNLGGVVVGVEGDISDSSTKESVRDVFDEGDSVSLRTSRDLYVGARVGLPVARNVLVYAKAGYTNARFKLKYNDTVTVYSAGDNLEGYRLGAGVEFSNDGGAFARLEYRYSDYGNYEYEDFDTGISASRHQVAVTAGYRF